MQWNPDSGETQLYRTSGRFAAGFAGPVRGLRSFRDFERRDIRQELPGWPDIPPLVPHTKKAQAADTTARGVFRAVPILIGMAVEAFGGNSFNGSAPPGDRKEPQEPQDEVEDFPVIWADPGTVARTLPWQLDAVHRPARLRTDLVLTDRRLLVLGHQRNSGAMADVLWQTPRDTIATAERRDFSEKGADVKIVFVDGSWTRLTTDLASSATRFAHHVRGTVRLLAEADLSTGQRERLSTFVAGLPANAEPPTLTELPSGLVDVQSRVPSKRVRGMFDTHQILMGPDGKHTASRPGDLD